MTAYNSKLNGYNFFIDFCDITDPDKQDLDCSEVSRESLSDQIGFTKVAEMLGSETEQSAEKFLTFWGTFARVGNQLYLNEDGSIRVVNRPEEEVIKSLNSFRNKPISLDHPEGLILPQNSKNHTVGISHEDVTYDRGLARIRITLLDEQAIHAIRESHQQLSAGYLAKVVKKDGNWYGDAFTHQQQDIYGNHIALVEKGRAGNLVVSHLNFQPTINDSKELELINGSVDDSKITTVPCSIQVYFQKPQNNSSNIMTDNLIDKKATKPESLQNLTTLSIDNLSLQLTESAAVAVNAKIQNDKKTIDELTLQVSKDAALQQESAAKIAELTTQVETANGKLKVQDAEIESLKQQLAAKEQEISDSKPDLAQMRKLMADRFDLEKKATNFLGKDNINLDGLSDREIKCQILEKIYNGKLTFSDSDNDNVVNAAYSAAILLQGDKEKTSVQRAKTAVADSYHVPYVADEADNDDDAIIAKQRQQFKDAASKPLSGNLSNFK